MRYHRPASVGDSRSQDHDRDEARPDDRSDDVTRDLERAETMAAKGREGSEPFTGGAAAPTGSAQPSPTAAALPDKPPVRRRGEKIDRFTVIETLGEGGMGVVVAAHDPTLDRKVAIKLLRREARVDDVGSTGAVRLIREAQAMARLSHPNVVAVHEVGTVDDEVFIAMEYVEGMTLGEWRDKQPRSWRDVVELLCRAGEGLAAAHAAGLVHRDFKPENVLVGEDGRVRVSDFGIVGAAETGAEVPPVDHGSLDRSGSVLHSVTLSSEGRVLGTLGYMAPEQFQQMAIDARADQFAFCVTLYETLYGQRPFAGRQYRELRRAVCQGELRPPPEDSEVPSWIHAVIARGLSVDPEERFPSMRALIDTLERDPLSARRRRWTRIGIAGAFGAAAATAGVALVLGLGHRSVRCEGAGAKVTAVWSDSVAGTVEKAFLATDRGFAGESYERVRKLLDRYADDWAKMHTETCKATHVRGEQDEQVLDLRMTCLDRRLSAMRELVKVLTVEVSPGVVSHAVEAATRLPPIAGCADVEALRSAVPPPEDPEVRARVEAVRARLDRAGALQDAANYSLGREVAASAVKEARAVGHDATLALALFRLGELQQYDDHTDEAEQSLRETIRLAARGKDDHLVAAAWLQLMWIIGDAQAHYDDALALRETVEAAIARAGNTADQRAHFLRTVGVILHDKGAYREAREQLEQAWALVEESGETDEINAAQTVRSLGLTVGMLGDLDTARSYHERALKIFERHFGSRHPTVALALESLGNLARKQGRYDDALAFDRRVLAIREEFLGPDHTDVALALNNLGVELSELDRYDEARAVYERALAIWQKHLRPGHPDLANALVNLGEVAAASGDLADAQDYFERALALLDDALGPDHVRTGVARFNLGNVLLDQGKCREALEPLEKALSTFEKALGAKHPFAAYPLGGIGYCRLELGEPEAAVAALERAVKLLESGPGNEQQLAATRFSLARALWHRPRERKRALRLAGLARESLLGQGERGKQILEKLDAWLKGR